MRTPRSAIDHFLQNGRVSAARGIDNLYIINQATQGGLMKRASEAGRAGQDKDRTDGDSE